VELRLIREVPRPEDYSDVDYNFYLKACEAMDIARKKTYTEHGGLNKISPLILALGHPMLEREMGRIGARNRPREAKVQGGRIAGRKNAERGHIQALTNRGNCKRWNINRGKPCMRGKHL
jgi:hypothetical protein